MTTAEEVRAVVSGSIGEEYRKATRFSTVTSFGSCGIDRADDGMALITQALLLHKVEKLRTLLHPADASSAVTSTEVDN